MYKNSEHFTQMLSTASLKQCKVTNPASLSTLTLCAIYNSNINVIIQCLGFIQCPLLFTNILTID